MKSTLKTLSWIEIVLGGLAIFGAVTAPDADSGYALIGGALILASGWVALNYIKETSN